MKKKIELDLQKKENTAVDDTCISVNTPSFCSSSKECISFKVPKKKDENESKKTVLGRKQEKFIAFQKFYEECKLKVPYPELLEFEDPASKDFLLLNALKAIPNSVSVPRHWKLRRNYLSSKKAAYKKPYLVPSHIFQTGICEARNTYIKQKVNIPLKAKLKQKLHPKIDRKEIEYNRIKYYGYIPRLTSFGEVYHEDKYQWNYSVDQKPGALSIELREALGMSDNDPIPWAEKIRKYGAPPAYSDFRVSRSKTDIQRNSGCSFEKNASKLLQGEEQSSVMFEERLGTSHSFQQEPKLFFLSQGLPAIRPQVTLLEKKSENERLMNPKVFSKVEKTFVKK